MNQKYRTLQTYTIWLIDMVCIVVSYLIATYIRYSVRKDWGDKTLHYMVCVVFLLFCSVYTFLADWNRDFLVRGYLKELWAVIKTVAIILIGSLVVVFFLQWTSILSRAVIINFTWMDTVLTYLVRIIFKTALRNHISNDANVTRVVVISEKALMDETVTKLVRRTHGLGYRVVRAYCADAEKPLEEETADPWYIGDVHVHYGINEITSRLVTDPFDEVFINTPHISQEELKDIIIGFEEMGVTTHYCIEMPDISKASPQVEEFINYSVITYDMNRTSYKRLFIKRIIDIIGGFVGLIFTGIITIFLALIVYLFYDDQETKKEIDEYNRKLKEDL